MPGCSSYHDHHRHHGRGAHHVSVPGGCCGAARSTVEVRAGLHHPMRLCRIASLHGTVDAAMPFRLGRGSGGRPTATRDTRSGWLEQLTVAALV
jgi:hypothetical protein